MPPSVATTTPEPARPAPAVEPLTYRLADLPRVLGVSARTIDNARARGEFPRPDVQMGRCPLWRRETIERWLAQGGGKP